MAITQTQVAVEALIESERRIREVRQGLEAQLRREACLKMMEMGGTPWGKASKPSNLSNAPEQTKQVSSI